LRRPIAQDAELALDPAQAEEQLLLGGEGTHFHHRPGTQDELGDRRANPPHRVGREPETTMRLELLDRLHQADVAFGDQVRHRQPIAAIPGGDLRHEAQVAGDEPMRRLDVALFGPRHRQHELFLRLQHRETAQISR
jgi:hypothetical protein